MWIRSLYSVGNQLVYIVWNLRTSLPQPVRLACIFTTFQGLWINFSNSRAELEIHHVWRSFGWIGALDDIYLLHIVRMLNLRGLEWKWAVEPSSMEGTHRQKPTEGCLLDPWVCEGKLRDAFYFLWGKQLLGPFPRLAPSTPDDVRAERW